MAAPPDIRSQLRSLSISKEQRPASSPPTVGGQRNGRWGWLIGTLLVVAVAVALYFSRDRLPSLAVSDSASADEIKLVPVIVRQPNESPPVLTATGKIVSDHRVEVLTKVSGQIVSLHFEQGDRVKIGQLLARIEDINYKARRDQAAAELERAKANLTYQQTNYERMVKLHESQNAPDIEFADSKRWYDDARAAVESTTAALAFAQKALNDCDVVAPIAGVILERNIEIGSFVAAEGGRGAIANAQLGAIADMATLRVEVDISELDIARVHKDLPCVVIPDAYKDRRYRGRVMWLDPGANYSKATVQAKVRIEDPDDHLRVEGSAQVVFMAGQPETSAPTAKADPSSSPSGPTLWIPTTACLPNSNDTSGRVFVASDGRLKETRVALGKRTGSEIEVTGGLSSGQIIASSGLDKLRDGQRLPAQSPK